MSSTVEEVETVLSQIIKGEIVHLMNGDVNGVDNGEENDEPLVSAHKLTCIVTEGKDGPHENQIENDETELINELEIQDGLYDYKRIQCELIKLQIDYKSSLERENNLCNRLERVQEERNSKVSELTKANEDSRAQFGSVLEELNGKKEELRETKCSLEETQKERDKFSTQLAKVHIEGSEERDGLHEQVKALDEEKKRSKKELERVEDKLEAHDTAAKQAIRAIQKEMALRVDQVTKMYEDALKDKETAVSKMTRSEEDKRKIIVEKELVTGKLIEHNKQSDKLKMKMKNVIIDLAKAETSLEEKEKEVIALQKEQIPLKDEMNSQVVKVKWAQNKLKKELESHKETKSKLNQTTQKLQETKEEGEMIRVNCQQLIKKYQESEEMKSNSLDLQLKEKENELKRSEQEIADQDEFYKVKVQELVILRNQERLHQETLKDLKEEVVVLEDKVTLYAVKVAEHEKKEVTLKKDSEAMKKTLQLANDYKTKYESEVQTVAQLNEDTEMLQNHIKDLEADLSGGTNNQSQLLEFTEKLTAKNAQLQSEVTNIQSKCDGMLAEKYQLEEQLEDMKQKKITMENQFKSEKYALQKKLDVSIVSVYAKTRTVEQLSLSLEEEKDELQVTKRKNNAVIKDLTKQLQQSRRQVEKLESNHRGSKESLNGDTTYMSKSSSSNSLDKINSNCCTSPVMVNIPINAAMTSYVTDSGLAPHDSVHIVQPIQPPLRTGLDMEPNKKILVDKICRLQKIHAKKNEKLEFMEEHINALVEEIQKKARIIQFYALREQSGALASATSDQNKVEFSHHGGIMASLYSSTASDPHITMDLSLEISRKLQAVLEDTILKNITLKENLDTLGDEISRLNQELTNLKQCGR